MKDLLELGKIYRLIDCGGYYMKYYPDIMPYQGDKFIVLVDLEDYSNIFYNIEDGDDFELHPDFKNFDYHRDLENFWIEMRAPGSNLKDIDPLDFVRQLTMDELHIPDEITEE